MNEKRAVEKILNNNNARYWEFKTISGETYNISVWNGKIHEIANSTTHSFSIRVLYKNGWGFAGSSLPFNLQNIEETTKIALNNAKISHQFSKRNIEIYTGEAIKKSVETKTKILPSDVSLEEKVNLLFNYDKRLNNKLLKSKVFSYSDGTFEKKFKNSEGSEITQRNIKVVVGTEMLAEENGRRETNFSKYAKTAGFETTNNFEKEIDETEKCLIRMLKGKNVKGGNFPVVADGVMTAVIIHEALGHAAEGDAIIQGQSCLENLIKKKISSKIDVIDDPTVDGLFGSFFYDDEGIKANKKYIIKDGMLKNFLHSRETAALLNNHPGNARAQGNSIPLVRMSNTFIEPQDYELDDMISEIKDGFYLKGSRGGEVDIVKGTFQFHAKECYKIKNGEICDMLKGVSLMGNIFDVLKNIEAVGKKKYTALSPGMCGKGGQNVPVDGINPPVKIKEVMIGST
ncbi:MAG: hypothetical protein BWK75_06070 [Candidatus Altiarchaeales archaeon A3]|nr:MAG: hypothetical protein BWK75_06070 [Candidatus Altiarchaeales archaeon A3]